MFRRVSISALAILAGLLVATQPVFALSMNGGAISGNIGKFEGPRQAEVICRYDPDGRLRGLTVRPIKLWGSYAAATRVAWQFEVRVAKEFHTGRLVYRSPLYRDLASLDVASGFTKQQFHVRESLPGPSAYYVRFVAVWYAPGSTTVDGKARLFYDRYVERQGSKSFDSNGCTFSYGLTWNGS